MSTSFGTCTTPSGGGTSTTLSPRSPRTSSGSNPTAGRTRGRITVPKRSGRTCSRDSEFVVEPDRFVVDGETVVALVTHRGTHAETGERFEAPVVDVWELEDGEVTRFRHYVGDLGHVQRRTMG
jgi:ketosteroid isomerase-like protein